MNQQFEPNPFLIKQHWATLLTLVFVQTIICQQIRQSGRNG